MIRIISIGKRNIGKIWQEYYKYLSNYEDLDFSVIVPDTINNDEVETFRESGKETGVDFIRTTLKRKFMLSSFSYEELFSAEEVSGMVQKIQPDIIEFTDNPDTQDISEIIDLIKQDNRNTKILLNLWKDPISEKIFSRDICGENLKKADFIIIRYELVKNLFLKTGIRTPYKVINYPCDPYLEPDDRDYSSDKVSIYTQIDSIFKNYLDFFDYTKKIADNTVFFCDDDMSSELLSKKGYVCESIHKVSSEEKNSIIRKSDIFLFLRKYDMTEPEKTEIIRKAMFLKIPVFLPGIFPFREIFKEQAFYMQDFTPEDFESAVFSKEKRDKNTEAAYKEMINRYSIKSTSSEIFNIYLFLYKMSKIKSA